MTQALHRWFDSGMANQGAVTRVLAVLAIAALLVWILHLIASRLIVPAKTDSPAEEAREEQTRIFSSVFFSIGAAAICIAAVWILLPQFGVPRNTEAPAVRVAVIIIGAFILNRIARAYTAHMIIRATAANRAAEAREQQTRTVSSVLYGMATAILILGAVLMILPEFGFHETPLAAAAGLASLAFGFGGQYLVRDVINGFFIIFEDQYSVGETIKLNAETGRVEHITLRRTVLRNPAGALVTIPNGQVGQVANLSRDWSQHFVDIIVPDEAAVPRAIELTRQAIEAFRADAEWAPLLVDGPKLLGVESIAPTGTTLRIQFRSAPTRNDEVARELRRRILAEMDRAGVELMAAHRIKVTGPGLAAPAAIGAAADEVAASSSDSDGLAGNGSGDSAAKALIPTSEITQGG